MVDKILKINHDTNIKLNTKVIYSELLTMIPTCGVVFIVADYQELADYISNNKRNVRD